MNIKVLILAIALTILTTLIFIAKPYEKILKPINTDIGKLEIVNYIPEHNDLKIISNANSFDLKEALKKNYSQDNSHIEIIKSASVALVGIDFKNSFSDLYDNEFSLSIGNINNSNPASLLIIKVKEEELRDEFFTERIDDINNIYKIDHPSYFNYFTLTEDKYLILSTNKESIIESLESIQNEEKIKDRKQFLNKLPVQFKSEKILLISRNNFFNRLRLNDNQFTITTIAPYDSKLRLRTYLINNNNFTDISKYNVINTEDKNKNIIYGNEIDILINYFSFIELDSIQMNIYKELNQNLNSEILFLKNGKYWIMAFLKENLNKTNINKLNIFDNYDNYNLNINSLNYNVWYKNSLENINNEINFIEKTKIFSCESDDIILISNSLSELIKGLNKEELSYKYLHKDINEEMRKPFINDMILVNDIDQSMIKKDYKIFNTMKYLTGNYLKISIDSIKAVINQQIPDINPEIYIETNIEII